MSNQQRKTFKSVQDWHSFIDDLKQRVSAGEVVNVDPAAFRVNCYRDIELLRKRPLLVYAAKFISPVLPGTPNSIDLGDVDGFTDLINSIPREHKKVDVIIHSPGGQPDATERIVYLLRNRFEEVHFLIPH